MPIVKAQAVANENQINLAANVTNQANDKLQAVPMVDQALECRRRSASTSRSEPQ
jgi:hypothetical protein